MSLIGIHESCHGSEIISIRVKEYIINNNKSPIDIGLGPDDIVTLQKRIEKKSDKGNKSKNQDQSKYRRFSSNEKHLRTNFESNLNRRLPFFNKNEGGNDEDEQTKNERLLLISNNNNKLYSHSPGGFYLNSQAAFPAYFSELLRRSTPTRKKTFWHSLFRPRTNSCNTHSTNSNGTATGFNTSYDDSFVSKGCYYSYNIFTHKDIIVTVDNPGGCQTMMVNGKGEFENNITNDDWKQVCLSSKLRFYRCSQPLLASFMFSKPIMTVCYYVYEVPYMNSDELEYCMEHYVHDSFSSNDDFEMSIAMSLIVNFDLKYVIKFIEKYDTKFPRLLLHIIKHIAPSSRFCKMLIPILINHMIMFSDDIDIAVIFFDIALANMKFDVCMSFLMPILKGSIWATPQCGVSIAKFCIKNDLFEEALEFLNLSSLVNAKKQKKSGYYISNGGNGLLKTLPRSKSLSESNKQAQSIPTFFRSTSMTLSIKKKSHEVTDPNKSIDNKIINNNDCSNEYEYEINNNDDSELSIPLEHNNNYYCQSISSSQSSKFSSPHSSMKNSYMEDKNSNSNIFDDDYESFSSSRPSSRLNSQNLQRKYSYTEGKTQRNNIFYDENELFSNSTQSSRGNSIIDDNHIKYQHNNDFENESFSSSRQSSRMSSGHSSRKNSCIEDTNFHNSKNNINFIDLLSSNDGFSTIYSRCAQDMTTPINSLDYGPTPSSCYLLDNHFVTLKSQILFALSEFIDKLGEAEFEEKRNEFINERPMADEEEMFDDDESEIYTSYFCSPDSLETNVNEEDESIDNDNVNEIYSNIDIADNDNYDYVNSNDFNYFNDEVNNSPKIDMIHNEGNNNNNETRDEENENIPNIQLLHLRIADNAKNTNSTNIPKLPHSAIFKNEHINSFSNLKPTTNKANSHIYFKINNNNASSNFRHAKCSLDSLPQNALFDPGIESSFDTISSLPDEIIHSMPASNYFLDCLSEIRKGYTESMLILAHQKDVTTSTQTSILFTALATNDRRLMEAMLNSFTEENRATGTDKLILLRGFTMNVTTNLEAILTIPLEPLTVIEKNALAFMEPFAIGIHRLNNTEI